MCITLCFSSSRIGSGGSLFGEADFSLISQRRNSITSRKSIEALNVVGVAGGVTSVEEGEGLKLHLPAASIHRGSVYKMTQTLGKGEQRGEKVQSFELIYIVHVHVHVEYKAKMSAIVWSMYIQKYYYG